jgi:dihydroneopterin aldolase
LAADYQRVGVRDLVVGLGVGVYEHEQGRRQRVRIDVELFRHAGPAGPAGLADCLDYDRLHRFLVEELPAEPHCPLLELLAERILGFALADHRVEACRVVLRKLDVYAGGAAPELEVFRHRSPP